MAYLRDKYKELITADATEENFEADCFKGLDPSEKIKLADLGYKFYEGKVRQCFTKDKEMVVVHTDRLSAFDCFIGYVPFKGMILSAISDFWFNKISGQINHHFIRSLNPRTIKVGHCLPIKAEIVVRGYLAGSMLRAYHEGRREFCGEILPEGLTSFGKLPEPILTPTSKAEAFEHDVETNPRELIRSGILTEKEWTFIKQTSLKLFEIGQRVFAEKGWILVDTKYEFGRTESGDIIVIDEIHTPDSSRLWVADTYENLLQHGQQPQMLDKENVRRWLIAQGFKGQGTPPKVPKALLIELAEIYLNVAENLIGHQLELPSQNDLPLSRLLN